MDSYLEALTHRSRSAVESFLKAFSFLPEDKRQWKPADTSRTALEILSHATYWTLYFTRILRGEGPLQVSEEEWLGSTQAIQDMEKAQKLAEESGKEFVKAVRKLSAEDLEREVELPWGRETLAKVVWDNYWHLGYHEGQLNYLQTMLGDTEHHW